MFTSSEGLKSESLKISRTTTHGNIGSKGMVIVQMHDEWGIVLHLVVC